MFKLLKFNKSFISKKDQAVYFFDNNYGVSVIKTSKKDVFNIAIIKGNIENWTFDYSTDMTDDNVKYRDKNNISEIMEKVSQL